MKVYHAQLRTVMLFGRAVIFVPLQHFICQFTLMFGYFLGKVETSASGDCERLREEEAALPREFLNAFYAVRFNTLNVHIKYD